MPVNYDELNWNELARICSERALPPHSGSRKSSWLDLKQRLVDNDEKRAKSLAACGTACKFSPCTPDDPCDIKGYCLSCRAAREESDEVVRCTTCGHNLVTVADEYSIEVLNKYLADLDAKIAELAADADILASAELISWRQYGLAEEICQQPTQKQINGAVGRAQKRARTAQRGV